VTDCSHAGLVTDCSTLMVQTVMLRCPVDVYTCGIGCIQSTQTSTMYDRRCCPLVCRVLLHMLEQQCWGTSKQGQVFKGNCLICCHTGNQWRLWRTGVTWSWHRAPDTRWAAIFCTDTRFISCSFIHSEQFVEHTMSRMSNQRRCTSQYGIAVVQSAMQT